jgi:steroid 5-alpha reductase family enzyme
MGRNELVFALLTVAFSALLLTSATPFWIALVAAIAMFTLLWLVSLALANASIVDIWWGPGFIWVAWFSLVVLAGEITARGLLVCGLVTLWGVRLALHIGRRNAGHGEDFRYAQWRRESGRDFWWISYFKVFLLQAVVLWIVATPIVSAQLGSRSLGVLDALGFILWLFGFVYEAAADRQLQRFRNDPANRGEVLRTGLWKLSRHPNYFGEAVLWLGIALIGVAGGGPIALISPVLLTFLLLKISGVAMLDRALIERRPGYADYVASTPAFIPWPLTNRRTNAAKA